MMLYEIHHGMETPGWIEESHRYEVMKGRRMLEPSERKPVWLRVDRVKGGIAADCHRMERVQRDEDKKQLWIKQRHLSGLNFCKSFLRNANRSGPNRDLIQMQRF